MPRPKRKRYEVLEGMVAHDAEDLDHADLIWTGIVQAHPRKRPYMAIIRTCNGGREIVREEWPT